MKCAGLFLAAFMPIGHVMSSIQYFRSPCRFIQSLTSRRAFKNTPVKHQGTPLNLMDRTRPPRRDIPPHALETEGASRPFSLRWRACFLMLGATALTVPALAQQKTGPGITGDDSLTWHGITLYGVIDIGTAIRHPQRTVHPLPSGGQRQHRAPEQRRSVIGLTPSNMGQSRVGLQGIEPLIDDWSAIFQMESFFNPQSGEIADSLKSLAVNNGERLTAQSVGVDGSSAGQAFQTAWVGLKSGRFGTLTFGRQITLDLGRLHQIRPQLQCPGVRPARRVQYVFRRRRQEDNRLDSTAKYSVDFDDLVTPRCAVQVQRSQRLGQHRLPGGYRRGVRGRLASMPIIRRKIAPSRPPP